jgi:hypothetical protein
MAPGTEVCQARGPGTVHMVAGPNPLVRTSMLAALLAADEEHREYPAVGFVNGLFGVHPLGLSSMRGVALPRDEG